MTLNTVTCWNCGAIAKKGQAECDACKAGLLSLYPLEASLNAPRRVEPSSGDAEPEPQPMAIAAKPLIRPLKTADDGYVVNVILDFPPPASWVELLRSECVDLDIDVSSAVLSIKTPQDVEVRLLLDSLSAAIERANSAQHNHWVDEQDRMVEERAAAGTETESERMAQSIDEWWTESGHENTKKVDPDERFYCSDCRLVTGHPSDHEFEGHTLSRVGGSEPEPNRLMEVEQKPLVEPKPESTWIIGSDWTSPNDGNDRVYCADCDRDVYFPAGQERHATHTVKPLVWSANGWSSMSAPKTPATEAGSSSAAVLEAVDTEPEISNSWTTGPLPMGLTNTVAAFLWGTAALYAVAAGLFGWFWYQWWLWDSGPSPGSPSLRDLRQLEEVAFTVERVAWLAFLLTGLLFVLWFYQAYKSAASRGATNRKWGAGWAVGSWFIPIAMFIIPKLVMNEVDRMSNPAAGKPPIGSRWTELPRTEESDYWWVLFLLGFFGTGVGLTMTNTVELFDSASGPGILLLAAGLGLTAASGWAGGFIVRDIGRNLQEPVVAEG